MVNGCAFGTFIASGQTCIAGTRILVEESIFKEFCEKLVAKVSKFNVGSPFDPLTHLGPVISPKQLEFIETLVQKSVSEGKSVSDNFLVSFHSFHRNLFVQRVLKGARVLCGGKRKKFPQELDLLNRYFFFSIFDDHFLFENEYNI